VSDLPPRLALIPLALCASFGCRSELERAAVVAEPDRQLRTELEAATRAPEPDVRRAAVRVLGARGQGTSIEAVGALLVDPDAGVRLATIEALGQLRMRGGDHAARVAELLGSAVRGGPADVRYFALCGLADCQAAAVAQLDTIRACCEDEPTDTLIAAAIALGELGETTGLEERAVELIQEHSGGPWDYSLAQLLPFLHERSSASALERLRTSADASVRFRAQCAGARLEGAEEPGARLETRWSTENTAAEAALQHTSLRRIPRSRVLDRAAHSRLVLCGEMHESAGTLRENQREVLRAFVREPEFEAVGFEPSVEDAQKSVLDLARALGLSVLPLETHWRELGAQGRSGARELEALEAIAEFLGKSPKNRMLVLRGESHVLPDGFLVRRLPARPLVILCGCSVSVPLSECGLCCNGSAFELGNSGDVYMLPYEDSTTAKERAVLERWLALPGPRTP